MFKSQLTWLAAENVVEAKSRNAAEITFANFKAWAATLQRFYARIAAEPA